MFQVQLELCWATGAGDSPPRMLSLCSIHTVVPFALLVGFFVTDVSFFFAHVDFLVEVYMELSYAPVDFLVADHILATCRALSLAVANYFFSGCGGCALGIATVRMVHLHALVVENGGSLCAYCRCDAIGCHIVLVYAISSLLLVVLCSLLSWLDVQFLRGLGVCHLVHMTSGSLVTSHLTPTPFRHFPCCS